MSQGILRRRVLMLAPLGAAAAGLGAFGVMLSRMQAGRFDPHDIGNPMLGKKMPDFSLEGIAPSPGFSSKDVIAAAQTAPVVLNFFQSTCIPCAMEADTLAQVAQMGVTLWGIAWKDPADKATAFLAKYGNPFARVAADSTGDTFINFGLYGVPETFVIDRAGHIAWHLAGGLSDSLVASQLMPAIEKAKG